MGREDLSVADKVSRRAVRSFASSQSIRIMFCAEIKWAVVWEAEMLRIRRRQS
jgi:hypothetical protein